MAHPPKQVLDHGRVKFPLSRSFLSFEPELAERLDAVYRSAGVKRAIAAANRIARKPYVYGGGHGPFTGRSARSASLDRGYDCSGAISFALFGGKFLSSPLNSSGFMGWGSSRKAVGSPSTRTPATPTS
jgi:hypothetical protein